MQLRRGDNGMHRRADSVNLFAGDDIIIAEEAEAKQ